MTRPHAGEETAAELYEEAARRERWLQATAEITSLLVRSPPGDKALLAVADRAREASGADVTWIVTGRDVNGLHLQAVSGAHGYRPCFASVAVLISFHATTSLGLA